MSELNTEIVQINRITPNPSNPRVIKDEKFKKLVQSIKDFPQMLEIRPIVVNDDMVVLGGNMRLRACQDAGLKEIPIIKASSLTPEQQKEFIIKDNVGFGEWDWAMLANDFDLEELEEWGLEVPGIQDTEIDYSDKNKEIDVDEFEDEMILKLKFSKDDFLDIQDRLTIAKDRFKTESNEDTLKELLSFHERKK